MTIRLALVLLAAPCLGACDAGDAGPADPTTRPVTTTITASTTASSDAVTAPAVDAVRPPDTEPLESEPTARRFPDVVGVDATFDDASSTWTFDVTISSPYDTPDRYADGWRVVGPGGVVYGTHTLAHDHADEQPFTRRQTGVTIPDDVDEVTIEGRDLANGFGGATLTVSLDRG